MRYPPPIENLIKHFNRLPGIGPKTAERLVLSLLKKSREEIYDFSHALESITRDVQYCAICHNLSEENPCQICADPSRDKHKLLITAKPQDLLAIENTGQYNGLYHILWGYLSPLEGTTPDQLKIKELLRKINKNTDLTEIILAFNLNMDGESTILYIYQLLKDKDIKISRLGRGLSMNTELEYADDDTLIDALQTRMFL